MDVMLLRIFQRQVADQCLLMLTAAHNLNEALAREDEDSLWMACQMFVVGAGNVSKALWGDGRNRKRVAPQRQTLRDSLDVDDSSPLFTVALRNHLEHYDERIDQWWAESTTRNHLDRMVGPPSMVVGLSDIDRFRVFDPAAASIIFWGQQYELQPLADEAARVYPTAMAEAAKPHWEPPSSTSDD